MAAEMEKFKLFNMNVGNFGDTEEGQRAINEIIHSCGHFDALFLQAIPWTRSESKFRT